MRSISLSQTVVLREASAELMSKAEICARVLVEAKKLSRAGRVGALGHQLLVRAGELLDDMDEIRASLDPVLNRSSFLAADALASRTCQHPGAYFECAPTVCSIRAARQAVGLAGSKGA
jgi:hypothetical protein